MSSEHRNPETVHRHDPVRLHEFGRIEERLHKMHKLLNGEDKLPPWVCAALYVLDKDDPLNAEVMERGRIRGVEIWNEMHPDRQVPVPAKRPEPPNNGRVGDNDGWTRP